MRYGEEDLLVIWGGGPVRLKRVDPFRRIDCGRACRRVRAGRAQKGRVGEHGRVRCFVSAPLPVARSEQPVLQGNCEGKTGVFVRRLAAPGAKAIAGSPQVGGLRYPR